MAHVQRLSMTICYRSCNNGLCCTFTPYTLHPSIHISELSFLLLLITPKPNRRDFERESRFRLGCGTCSDWPGPALDRPGHLPGTRSKMQVAKGTGTSIASGGRTIFLVEPGRRSTGMARSGQLSCGDFRPSTTEQHDTRSGRAWQGC